MRILFAGTPEFAVLPLEFIARRFTVCGVLTAPDKRSGRGNRIIPGKVKEKALSLGLNVFDPENLDKDALILIKEVNPDILVVAAYGKIFKKDFLDIFPSWGINIHPSLLPRHRGPSPIPAAILAGDTESGVTIQRIALKMDQGNILMQKSVAVMGNETTLDLTESFSRLGAESVVEVLTSLQNNTVSEAVQDENAATYCKLIKKEHGRIDWRENANHIERKIRAYYPWPKSYTTFKGLQLCITKACVTEITENPAVYNPGRVFGIDKKRGFLIQTGDGVLCISQLKLQTKREMNFKDFLNGHKDFINSQLGGP